LGRTFLNLFFPTDIDRYEAAIVFVFGVAAYDILKAYPCNDTESSDCRPVMAEIATHKVLLVAFIGFNLLNYFFCCFFFVLFICCFFVCLQVFSCPTRNAARTIAAKAPQLASSIYIYYYDHPLSFPGWGANFSYCNGHVCHGSELPVLYNSATSYGFVVS
jgi:hypothetical protein